MARWGICGYGRCRSSATQSVVLPSGETVRYCTQHAYQVGQRAAKAWRDLTTFAVLGLEANKAAEKQWCLEQVARLADVDLEGLDVKPGTPPSGAPPAIKPTRLAVGKPATISSHVCAVVTALDLFERRYDQHYRIPGTSSSFRNFANAAPVPQGTFVITEGDYDARRHSLHFTWERHDLAWLRREFDSVDLVDFDGEFFLQGATLRSYPARHQGRKGALVVVDERVLTALMQALSEVDTY